MNVARLPACAVLLRVLLVAGTAAGQEVPAATEDRVEILAGIGYTFTSDFSTDKPYSGRGRGGSLQGEYVFRPDHVVSPRLYSGLLATFSQSDSCGTPSLCDVQSKIFYVGAKLRAMAPIPWVGPYVELGLGASAGYLRTHDGVDVDETSRGVTIHVPLGIGVAIGRHHEYDFGFNYLFHPAEKQVGGAVAFGVSFAVR